MSFMYVFGMCCPIREAIEEDDDLTAEAVLRRTKAHEKNCQRCQSDLDALYASGMLNGPRE